MGFREIAGAFAGALAGYGGWRWLAHLVARQAATGGRALRYWWPTAMVAWSWFTLWTSSFPGASAWLGWVRDPLFIAYFGINFPEAVVGNYLLGVLIGAPGAVQALTVSAVVWVMWWAAIRFWQSRKAAALRPALRKSLLS